MKYRLSHVIFLRGVSGQMSLELVESTEMAFSRYPSKTTRIEELKYLLLVSILYLVLILFEFSRLL